MNDKLSDSDRKKLREFDVECIREGFRRTGNTKFVTSEGVRYFVMHYDEGAVAEAYRKIDESELSSNPYAFKAAWGNFMVKDKALDVRIDDE